ncbi:hypothetical protein BVRB_7g158370 [Beta vulgaris subsp. vulgaris]|nr:hypothetical protein BVRB_7g158370 [Beta vulgaris subsp. vulgaris]
MNKLWKSANCGGRKQIKVAALSQPISRPPFIYRPSGSHDQSQIGVLVVATCD